MCKKIGQCKALCTVMTFDHRAFINFSHLAQNILEDILMSVYRSAYFSIVSGSSMAPEGTA